MNIRTALALGASLAAMTSTALAAGQCRAESAAALTPLIELYTSEGCNSCPPADRWLQGLRADGIAPQKVSALAFHVDYWDYIGWKDRFASPAYGVRQQAAVRRAGGRTVYTPQVMLDGADLRNWRSAALPPPSQPAQARLTLTGSPAADGGWLNRLYQAASRPYPWRLVDFDVLDAALAIQYGGGYEKLAAILNDADRHWPVPHRAGPDAQRLHKIARAIVDPRYREALTGH